MAAQSRAHVSAVRAADAPPPAGPGPLHGPRQPRAERVGPPGAAAPDARLEAGRRGPHAAAPAAQRRPAPGCGQNVSAALVHRLPHAIPPTQRVRWCAVPPQITGLAGPSSSPSWPSGSRTRRCRPCWRPSLAKCATGTPTKQTSWSGAAPPRRRPPPHLARPPPRRQKLRRCSRSSSPQRQRKGLGRPVCTRWLGC